MLISHLRIALFLLSAMILSNFMAVSQQAYAIENIRYPLKPDKLAIFNKALAYIEKDKDLALDSANIESGEIIASGRIKYMNEVSSDLAANSEELQMLTCGFIDYQLLIHVNDSSYAYSFTNFTHVNNTNNNRYSFGLIPADVKEFLHANTFDESWSRLVYGDIKETCRRMTRVKWIKIHW